MFCGAKIRKVLGLAKRFNDYWKLGRNCAEILICHTEITEITEIFEQRVQRREGMSHGKHRKHRKKHHPFCQNPPPFEKKAPGFG
jgi:hypothetical protein